MSEYIATAKVKVEPDTKGFEKALREKLKPILAKPFGVKVEPITKGFAGAITKALAAKPIAVPILPANLDAFSRAVTEAAISAKVGAVPDVDVAAFRAALQIQVDAASAGVVATIPAVPVAGAAVGAAVAETAALQKAITDLTASLTKLSGAQAGAAKTGANLGNATKKLTGDKSAVDKINKSITASELALVDAQNASLSVQERLDALTVAATKSRSAYAAATDLVATSNTAEANALRNSASALQAKVAAERAAIADAEKLIAQTAKEATFQTRLNKVVAESAAVRAVDVRAITALNIAKTQHQAISAVMAKLQRLENAALREGITLVATAAAEEREALAQDLAALKTRLTAINSEIKAQRRLAAERIAAGRTATGQLSFARRGAAATALSLLGIRGATLAATGAFLAGAAGATLFALSVKSAVDLEQELNVFAETAGATADEMDRVRATAEELGRDIRLPGISASEATQAMTGLAKAGLSVRDSIAGATGVLQLSIAANIDLARSTEIVASALNAFSLSGEEAIRVADVLANSANLAQGSIDDMGIAMQQAAAVGRQAGLSFEDTATFLTILARAGLRGSDAGTSLRTGLIRLINPTEKAQKILDRLGVSIRDAEGNVRPEVFQNLAAATASMSKAQRDQTIAQLAGNDAVRAFSIIMRLTTPELIKFRAENRKLGTAQALTEARAKGLAGAARGLASNLQTTGISIGRYATPALHGFVDNLNTAVLAISSSDQVAETFTTTFSLLGQTLHTAGTALGTVAPTALQAASALQSVALGIGVPEILAGLAAYRVVPAVLIGLVGPASAASAAFASLRLSLATTAAAVAIGGPLSTGLSGLRIGLTAAAAGVATFATSVAGVALIAATVAAAFVFMATRATALEKAQKNLKESTDALSASMSASATSSQAAGDALSAVSTERLATQSARLNVELAQFTLRNSDAAKGSLERRQLENALAIALDNQRLTQERFTNAIKKSREAQEEAAVAAKNLRRARSEEVDSLAEIIERQEEWAKILISQNPGKAEEIYRIAIQQTNTELQKRIETLEEENTVASRDLAKRLEAIKKLQTELARPLKPQELRILINANSVRQGLQQLARELGIQGDAAVKEWVKRFLAGMQGFDVQIVNSLKPTFDALIAAFEGAGRNAQQAFNHGFGSGGPLGPSVPNTFGTGVDPTRLTANEVLGRIAGLERQRRRARIAGGGTAEEQAFLAQEEQLIRQRIAAGKLSVAQRAKLEQELERIIGEQEQIANDIQQNEEDAQRAAEEAADKAKDARDKRDAAFLALLGRREQKILNAQARAALSEGIRDDIVVNRNLRKLYKQQIDKIRERVKDKETRNAAIRELQKKIFQLDLDFIGLQKQAQEERNQRIRESLELDISFFSTTENVRGEIRARRALIEQLKKQQADTKKGTVEYKRLRNEIAEQEAAIKDLKEQVGDRNDAFAELTFEFLQAQQGFAANLFGNLIPTGFSAGLVGNVSPTSGAGGGGGGGISAPAINLPHGAAVGGGPQGPFTVDRQLTQANAAAASRRGSPRAQFNTEIEVLRQILLVLNKIEQRDGHPESRRSKIHLADRSEGLPHGV